MFSSLPIPPSSRHITDSRWPGNFKYFHHDTMDRSAVSGLLLPAGALTGRRTEAQSDLHHHQGSSAKPASLNQL